MDTFLFLLLVLVLSSLCVSNARELRNQTQSVYDSGLQMNTKPNLCALCQEFTADAVSYISEIKTKTQIMEILHESCSRVFTFEKQCVALVDYYAPLVFMELQETQPKTFCQKVDLCEENQKQAYHHPREDKCEICKYIISEAQTKLKDPDTQLEIVELLLKACKSMKGQVKKCKAMVLEYLPLILVNAEHFLEATDICTTMHACPSASSSSIIIIEQASSLSEEKASVVSV